MSGDLRGCTFAGARKVRLVSKGTNFDMATIDPVSTPWHHLVCDGVGGRKNLQALAKFLRNAEAQLPDHRPIEPVEVPAKILGLLEEGATEKGAGSTQSEFQNAEYPIDGLVLVDLGFQMPGRCSRPNRGSLRHQ